MSRTGVRLRSYGLAACLAMAAPACSGNEDQASEAAYVETMLDFMNEELDVVADKIWENQGYIITAEGEESLFPTTEKGWAEVAAAADDMAALSEELAKEKYSRGETDWITYSEGLGVAAGQVKAAALAQDKEAVFEAGGLMYRVCRSCHERFRTYGEGGS